MQARLLPALARPNEIRSLRPRQLNWCNVVSYLVEQPVLLLFVLLALGTALGNLRIKGISIGPAAVLFVALGASAIDPKLALPAMIGNVGLALFAYGVGVMAGPSFFSSLRTGAKPVALVAGTLTAVGGLCWGLGALLGLTPGSIAGLYAGANTNTPALAAAVERMGGAPDPTVAYGLTYAGGVIIMLAAAAYALRSAPPEGGIDEAAPDPIRNATIKVTRDNVLTVRELTYTPYGRVLFSRHQVGDNDIHVSRGDTLLKPGDRVLVIGPQRAIDHVVKQLGRLSQIRLDEERHDVDFRRMVLSQKKFYGRTIGDLDLWRKYDARATRVRRADHDFLATDGFILQAGDRIRVAAPKERMADVARYLGDSEHGSSDINPLGLAVGVALGLLLGQLPILVPGLGTLELGHAAGPLIVGLILGRLQRTGPVVWSLPHQSIEVLNQLGILLFLAYAGGRAGSAFVDAIRSPLGPKLIVAGLLVTAVHAIALIGIAKWGLRASGQRIAGYAAASQTQPAVLAFANSATNHDERVALGYALVYPVAMVTKIVIAQLLTLT